MAVGPWGGLAQGRARPLLRPWGAAKASWGDGTSRTKAWSKQQIDTVLEKGPQPLLAELARIRPRRAEGREEMHKLREYGSRNAHRL